MSTGGYTTINASCHCGANRFELKLLTSTLPIPTDCCHCTTCRRATGQFINVAPNVPVDLILDPAKLSPTLTQYKSSSIGSRYFCSTCGADVAFHRAGSSMGSIASGLLDRADGIVKVEWHWYVSDTVDGGLTNLLLDGVPRYEERNDGSLYIPQQTKSPRLSQSSSTNDTLDARCACGNVHLTLHRPAYSTVDDKCKWITDTPRDKAKWPASGCFCTSCRKVSGHPITHWAFVPKSHLVISSSTKLTTYKSSEDVIRYFCGTCGAIVFYFVEDRPTMWDVALGLMEIKEGEGLMSTLESWFEFSTNPKGEDAVDSWAFAAYEKGVKQRLGGTTSTEPNETVANM